MATQVTIKDPAKAKTFFEAKMAFTTGPVELERMMKNNEVTRSLFCYKVYDRLLYNNLDRFHCVSGIFPDTFSLSTN